MEELTLKRSEAFHRALVQGGTSELNISGQRVTTAAAIELVCALYETKKGPGATGINAGRQGMWKLICASGWPWNEAAQELEEGYCGLKISPTSTDGVALLPFVQRMQRILNASGFDSDFSRAVAGAFIEMAGNINEHSLTSKPGMVGYEIVNGRITCCFADLGVGVLQSLRLNPKYSALQTSAQALDEAMKTGVSRFTDSGRGYGFADLLRAITEQWGLARLRTGQAKVVLDRTTESRTKIAGYCPDLPGLQIVFSCGATSPSTNFSL